MTSITQQIPNYIAGISQQPDELKVPGQLRAAKNVLPDVTQGLIKRPSGKLIGGKLNTLDNTPGNSKWFHYYRDEAEQYIGQIKLSNGNLKMWRCSDGAEYSEDNGKIIFDANNITQLKDYLKTTDGNGTIVDSDLQTLTLNDYTYVNNRNCTILMNVDTDNVETIRPPEAFIELKKVAYANQYAVNLFDTTATTTVDTATRIEVRLIDSSNNYCNSSGKMVSIDNRDSSNQTNRCTHEDAGDSRDSFAPNVGTKIFSITDGDTISDADAIYSDAAQTIAVNNGSGNSDRKDLYFRITTTGQSVPHTTGTGENQVTTYQARYTTTHDLLFGGSGWQEGDFFNLWFRNARYKITILEKSTSVVQANLGLIRPRPTSFDTKTTVTAESILGNIRGQITSDTETGNNFTGAFTEIIGNGIYIRRNPNGTISDTDGTVTGSNAFQISTPVNDLLNVFTDSVKDVADLPSQCKHGYVVKVSNSEAEEDDYYVKFFGQLKTGGNEDNDADYLDGEGVWEECAKPGITKIFKKITMPLQIVRQANDTFTVGYPAWEDRQVGDTITSPEPSFVGKKINKMMFFRNRLVMLSDENIIMSRPGNFFNFWNKSAITFTATDPIDISCSSEFPAVIYDGIQVNAGLVLFTKNQQFMLTTDSDILSPLTAKINSISTYNFNYKTNPISLGTTIAFLDNAGKYARFFEMQAVLREGEPTVFEQSKNISKLFPNDIGIIANSRENSTVFFTIPNTNKLYGFKYFQAGDQRIQQAWFEWELNGKVQHLAMLDDALYAVIMYDNDAVTLQKFSLKLDDNSHTVVSDDTYRIHLDNSKSFVNTDLTYIADGDYTSFNHTAVDFPISYNDINTSELYVVAVSTGTDKEFNGLVSKVTTFNDNGTTKIKIPGNWTTSDSDKAFKVVLGYSFEM